MSGSSRKRHSKWDHRDSEALSEDFSEKDPPRKTREPPSPSRGSRRHESNRRERNVSSNREDDNIRPDLDELRYQHQSRSPRNGRGRSYRSRSRSWSRSRSRSRSPAYSHRREPSLTERNRGKSGGSTTICKDFIAGRCRRGTHCFFLHQDAEFDDDSRENRDPKNGGSKYSVDDSKDYSLRSERPDNVCTDFMKGRCRRGSSCRFVHHEGPMADAFEKGTADNRRIKENYPDRNYDRKAYRRVATPCRFFAVGKCRNGNHCKFSHHVEENFSPERRSRDDRRGSDRRLDRSPVSDEPHRWSDDVRVSNVPAEHDWEEDKGALSVKSARSGDEYRDHGMVERSGTDEPKIGDERPTRQWKTECSGALIGVDNKSDDVANSSLYLETPSLSNISYGRSQTPRDKHHRYDFLEPKVSGGAFSGEDPGYEEKPNVYTQEENNAGIDHVCTTPNPPTNVQPDPHVNVRPHELQLPLHHPSSGGDAMQLSPLSPSINARGISPGDPRVKFRSTSSTNPPLLSSHSSGGNSMQVSHNHSSFFDNIKASDDGQGQLSLPLHSPGENGMQVSRNSTTFLDNKGVNEPQFGNANVMEPVSNHSTTTVSNEHLAQLSHHLSMNLAQLLEARQQLNLSSASNPGSISGLPDTIQPSRVSEAVKQYDPICDITEHKTPKSGNQMLPNIVEQKSSDNEPCFENINVSKEVESGGKIAEGGSKAADEDGKKLKDTKGLRSFKFALADYTKELLKPAWKDGKVNKESYKTIVKKVVDKVIETQGPQIPQTKEKIDHYLSCSKSKLEKLVQAYVGKYKT